MWTGNWDLCQAAADAVLRGESLRALSAVPAAFTDRDMDGLYGSVGGLVAAAAAAASPENSSSSAPSTTKRRNANGGASNNAVPAAAASHHRPPPPAAAAAAGLLLQSSCHQLDLCLTPALSPPGAGPRGCAAGASDEYSATTTCEDQTGDHGHGEPRPPPPLLNLFN